MKYSLNLLKHFIAIQDSPENIAQNLTLKSCEIEHIDKRVIPKEVVIGKVTKIEKHPNADTLNVCQVDCGSKGVFQIVTGGENVQEGTFVAAALPGCYLPVIDLAIGARQMRGLDSNGMICSKGELGIDEDEDKHWIWTLDEDFDDLSDTDKGVPFSDKYPRLENVIFDVDNKTVTHRPDLTGCFGLAFELQAMYQDQEGKISFNTAKKYSQQMSDNSIIQTLENAQKAKISITSQTELLRSYIALEINNIKVNPSSLLARNAVRDTGGKPINNWVDFSNIFMNLTGQPIHFFDADTIEGNITVRMAHDKEKFTDLFEKEHELCQQDIVIADNVKVLAIAGVVGGLHSGITEKTQNIVVEIANFDPVCVRKTALRLATRTDASMRFEKNINPGYSLYTFLMFLDLLQYFKKDLGEYTIGGVAHYVKDQSILQSIKIDLSTEKLLSIIRNTQDISLSAKAVNILQGLGFNTKINDKIITTKVPLWRGPTDINIPEDIIEEVARISGYDSIEPIALSRSIDVVSFPHDVQVIRSIENTLSEKKYYTQIETYPWAENSLMDQFSQLPNMPENAKDLLLTLKNPLSPETANLRNSMFYNLFSYAKKNHKFYEDFMLYDIGKVRSEHFVGQEKNTGVSGNHAHERQSLGAITYQKKYSDWNQDLILACKSHITSILSDLGLQGKIEYTPSQSPHYHPKKQANILYNKQNIGHIGQIHPLALHDTKFDQNAQVVYFELDIDTIINWYTKKKEQKTYSFETLQDQIISRDLCFVVDKAQNFGDVLNAVKSIKAIQSTQVFDLYQGEKLEGNRKSIALSITIKGDGSMTTEQINDIMNQAIEKAGKAGGELRK